MISENQTIISNSPEETILVGEMLAKRLTSEDVIAFKGGLGMGKTHFITGIAKGLGFIGDTSSPTFSLINEYRTPTLSLCHMDAYRLTDESELFETGFFEYLDMGWVVAVEWSENIFSALEPTFVVEIERVDDTTRNITITKGKIK